MTIRSKVASLLLLSSGLIAIGASTPLKPSSIAAGGDTCATAVLIPSVPFNDSGDTTGATDNIRITGCAGISLEGPDLIYVFNVQPGNNLTFTLTPTKVCSGGTNPGALCTSNANCTGGGTCVAPEYDPAIYIRTACPQGTGLCSGGTNPGALCTSNANCTGGGTCVSCLARADSGLGGQAETITISGLAPGAYYFYIDSVYPPGDPAGEGRYTLSVTGTLGIPNNTSFYTLTPCRILDTRDPAGPFGGPALNAGATRVFPIAGQCNVPATAKSVAVNVTVSQPTAPGHLILFPGGTIPSVSTINFGTGQTRANNAIVPLSASGTLSVADGQSSGTTHFILDVNGYFQ